ncbi:MAG TPA: ATP-dependent DNA helicase UvrD2 [Acidimicrobiales bacterium]|nr:ATP-dependent DNA helicase UvrD2 [Acidimicrobiales bacterium]
MVAPGPAVLGRGVVVTAGDEVPPAWDACPVVTVDEAALADPGSVVGELHESWAGRRPVVVVLEVDPARFRSPASWTDEPWVVGAEFEPWLDRLQFLVWANTYDARGGGEPVWWWARKAERVGAGAQATPEGPADILLPDGRPAWVDGGPRSAVDIAVAGAAPGSDPGATPAATPAGATSHADDGTGVAAIVIHAESIELGRLTEIPPPAPPAASVTSTLAPDQLAAVAHAGGPARVIAPAGSGKTRVLTERLRHVMVDRGFERETVLAVAYNKKAQEELEERCVSFRPRVQTLNALGYALLREARGRAPRVLEEREVRHMLDGLLPRRQRRANTDPMAPYLEGLSLIRLGLRDPDEVEEERDDVPGLAAAFAPYRRQLLAAGAVDFDDQVYAAIETLLRDGDFRRRAQAGCRHLLVDEFQDLTPAHLLMLRLLATPGLDVFGVGDDDQVIYGHAGADPAFLVHFDKHFPGAADHRLEVNYRCPVAVIDAARHLLSYNHLRVVKEIRPGPGSDDSAESLQVHRHAPEAGATALAEVVQGWLADPSPAAASPAQIAVLTRVNSLLLAPHVALAEAGIPINSVLRPQVLERTGVRAALAYLRIGADPERVSGADVIEIYRRPSRGFPQWFTKWLRGHSSLEALRRIGDKIDDDKVAAKVDDLVDDLELVAKAVQGRTTRHALTVIKDRVGLGGAMGLLDGSATGEGGSSHLDDLEALEQVAALHPDPSSFEPWLRGVFHREAEPGGVTLSTVHRVKGREWDRVAVFGVTAGIVPHRLAVDEEEERRVLHVAITRGRHRVAVLADQSRPSPFLDEMAGTAPHRPKGWPVPTRAGVGAADTEVLSRSGISGTGAGGAGPPVPAAAAGGSNATAARRGAAAAARAPLDPPATPEIAQAEAALKAWRTDRSRRDKVPAFIVLNDRYLRAVATRRPHTLKELRTVDGIGPTKLDLYGEEILAVLEAAGAGIAAEPAEPDL